MRLGSKKITGSESSIAAIEDPDPVIFFEPKRIYNGPFDGHHDKPVKPWSKHPASEVPEGHYTVPIGKAEIRREGSDLTIVATSIMAVFGDRMSPRNVAAQSAFCVRSRRSAVLLSRGYFPAISRK